MTYSVRADKLNQPEILREIDANLATALDAWQDKPPPSPGGRRRRDLRSSGSISRHRADYPAGRHLADAVVIVVSDEQVARRIHRYAPCGTELG